VTDAFEIEADREQLHRIITNLCRNGIEAMTATSPVSMERGGTRPKQMIIEARHEHGKSIIDIKDTGPGFSAQARAHLFEPFQGSSRKRDGTGLGLAICDELVRAHDGVIRLIEGEGWRGTHFEIRL